MPVEVWLTIALVLGFIVAAGAIMAVLAWTGVAVFRYLDRRRGPRDDHEQSITIADGLFELSRADDAEPDPYTNLESRP